MIVVFIVVVVLEGIVGFDLLLVYGDVGGVIEEVIGGSEICELESEYGDFVEFDFIVGVVVLWGVVGVVVDVLGVEFVVLGKIVGFEDVLCCWLYVVVIG